MVSARCLVVAFEKATLTTVTDTLLEYTIQFLQPVPRLVFVVPILLAVPGQAKGFLT